jgi:CheY-like chemotaxis protein
MDTLKGIVHDINNKIGLAQLIIKKLSRKIGKDNPEVDKLSTVLETSNHLLHRLHEATMKEACQSKLPIENIFNKKEFESARLEKFAHMYDMKLEIKMLIPDDCWFYGNIQTIDRVLSNCIENAKNAEADKVLVEYRQEDNFLTIKIKDNGRGMSEEALSQIGYGYSSQEGHLHGTGTQVIRKLVTDMGGNIKWSSIEGVGSCSTISFKLVKDEKIINDSLRVLEYKKENQKEFNAFEGKTILIVDDNPMLLSFFSNLMEDSGAQIITATDGSQALNLIYKHSPDCIITDWVMPDMSGLELCEKIKSDDNLKQTPLMMLTYRQHDDDLIASIKAGADDYVFKNTNTEVILIKIQALLRMKSLNDEVNVLREVKINKSKILIDEVKVS